MSTANDFVIEKNILTKYRGPGGNVTVPYGVTGIGSGAFAWCKSLTGITIPGSVTVIGWEAFKYCEGLSEITLPNSVVSICAGNCGSRR